MDNHYFVSREGSMGEPVRPGTPPVGKTVGSKDPYWTVYRWVNRTTKTAEVVQHGFDLKGAVIEARCLDQESKSEPEKLPKKQDKEYLRQYNREYARKRRAKNPEHFKEYNRIYNQKHKDILANQNI